nr:MAG TPA: hypothetical protein [Caudoviricetes sp.]
MSKKEVRLTLNTEKDQDIIQFLNSKSSKVAYIKDIVRLHMKIEESYMANSLTINATPLTQEEKQDKYDFDITDLGF